MRVLVLLVHGSVLQHKKQEKETYGDETEIRKEAGTDTGINGTLVANA